MAGSGPVVPTAEYFDKGQWGWDGSQWRKLPLLWGYSDNYIEAQSDLNAAAVVGTLTFATVPAGEIWRITQWIGVDVQTKCTNYILELVRSAVPYSFSTVVPAAANDYKGTQCDVILKEDDSLRMAFVGTVAGDDIYGWVHGYKMAVT